MDRNLLNSIREGRVASESSWKFEEDTGRTPASVAIARDWLKALEDIVGADRDAAQVIGEFTDRINAEVAKGDHSDIYAHIMQQMPDTVNIGLIAANMETIYTWLAGVGESYRKKNETSLEDKFKKANPKMSDAAAQKMAANVAKMKAKKGTNEESNMAPDIEETDIEVVDPEAIDPINTSDSGTIADDIQIEDDITSTGSSESASKSMIERLSPYFEDININVTVDSPDGEGRGEIIEEPEEFEEEPLEIEDGSEDIIMDLEGEIDGEGEDEIIDPMDQATDNDMDVKLIDTTGSGEADKVVIDVANKHIEIDATGKVVERPQEGLSYAAKILQSIKEFMNEEEIVDDENVTTGVGGSIAVSNVEKTDPEATDVLNNGGDINGSKIPPLASGTRESFGRKKNQSQEIYDYVLIHGERATAQHFNISIEKLKDIISELEEDEMEENYNHITKPRGLGKSIKAPSGQKRTDRFENLKVGDKVKDTHPRGTGQQGKIVSIQGSNIFVQWDGEDRGNAEPMKQTEIEKISEALNKGVQVELSSGVPAITLDDEKDGEVAVKTVNGDILTVKANSVKQIHKTGPKESIKKSESAMERINRLFVTEQKDWKYEAEMVVMQDTNGDNIPEPQSPEDYYELGNQDTEGEDISAKETTEPVGHIITSEASKNEKYPTTTDISLVAKKYGLYAKSAEEIIKNAQSMDFETWSKDTDTDIDKKDHKKFYDLFRREISMTNYIPRNENTIASEAKNESFQNRKFFERQVYGVNETWRQNSVCGFCGSSFGVNEGFDNGRISACQKCVDEGVLGKIGGVVKKAAGAVAQRESFGRKINQSQEIYDYVLIHGERAAAHHFNISIEEVREIISELDENYNKFTKPRGLGKSIKAPSGQKRTDKNEKYPTTKGYGLYAKVTEETIEDIINLYTNGDIPRELTIKKLKAKGHKDAEDMVDDLDSQRESHNEMVFNKNYKLSEDSYKSGKVKTESWQEDLISFVEANVSLEVKNAAWNSAKSAGISRDRFDAWISMETPAQIDDSSNWSAQDWKTMLRQAGV
jgi:preprotein translocase subunit YajC